MERLPARALVYRMRYRPGWRFFIQELTEDKLVVRTEIDTVDSSRFDAPYGYPNRITLLRELTVTDLAVKQEQRVAAELLAQCIFIDVHEAREFFRFMPSWTAPFHPHRLDGQQAWQNTLKGALIELLEDDDNDTVGEVKAS